MKLTIQRLLLTGRVTQIINTFWDLISVLLNILCYSQVMKKMTCLFLHGSQLENDWHGWNSQPWGKRSHYFTVFYSLGYNSKNQNTLERNMMLSIIEFSWFLRISLMISNHFDDLFKPMSWFSSLTIPGSIFTYRT